MLQIWNSGVLLLLALSGHPVLADSDTSLTIYVDPSSPNATNDTDCWDDGQAIPCASFQIGVEGLWRRSQQEPDGVTLKISAGTYILSESFQFSNVNKVSIYLDADNGLCTSDCVNVLCDREAGLSFVRTINIEIRGIHFHGCSSLHSSTSADFSSNPPSFREFYVGLYFLYCGDVTLYNITVSNTPGTGVVFYNTNGINEVQHSFFLDNTYMNGISNSSGGGVYIEFSYCEPDQLDCLSSPEDIFVDPFFTHDARYTFAYSSFSGNNATVVNRDSDTFILPHLQYHMAFGRGGGLSIFFKGNATRNSISLNHCSFVGNGALWGGGLFVEYQDRTSYNNVTLTSCIFTYNALPYTENILFAGTGGGGARVGYVTIDNMDTYANNVTFDGCAISNNFAYFGGGISMYAAKQISIDQPQNMFILVSTHVEHNAARLGSGVDMSLYHASRIGRPIVPVIRDCTFRYNTVKYHLSRQTLVGIGSVYIDSLRAEISGKNEFSGNVGTALVLLASSVEVKPGATILFQENSGRNGGAIAFIALSNMIFFDNTGLRFIRNSAQYQGGAMYNYNSGEHDLLSSRNCFIQFWNVSSSPNNWTARFYFENNRANGQPNSIYSTTIIPCLWGGPQGSAEVNISNCFCWKTWEYNGSRCSLEISSAPSSYEIASAFSTIPGSTLDLNATVYDRLNHTISHRTVFVAKILNGTASFRGEESLNYNYISNSLLDLQGEPNTSVHIQLETLDPIVVQTNITVHLKKCPPGFTSFPADGESGAPSFVCKCTLDTTENYYGGYVRCYTMEFRSEILRGEWMGLVSGIEELVVGHYPYTKTEHFDSEYIDLPSEPEGLNALFCNRSNRQGVLCGSCMPGYGPSVTSLECVKCPTSSAYYGWIIYLLVIFLPITVFFCLMFVFSMSITYGPLNSFIFFAQVITTAIRINADGMIEFTTLANNNSATLWVMNAVDELYMVIYGVWNLDFFLPWLPPFCLSPNINTLTLDALLYMSALYPLILLAILSLTTNLYNRGFGPCITIMRPFHRCLARMRGKLNLRHPVTGGIATFIVISYTKFNFISLRLLTPSRLVNASGVVVSQVMYRDGDIEFGKPESTPYIILAVTFFILFGVIPPILLILPSILHMCAQLTNNRIIQRLQPSGKILAFLEVFHGCYKDGTNNTIDCRWFAGLYFIFRIVALVIATSSNTWLLQYCIQTLFFLIGAFMFAAFRPYKRDWINVIDTGFFLILAAVTGLSSYNLALARAGNSLSQFAYVVQCFLVLIPLVYCTTCAFGFFCSERIQKFMAKRRAARRMQLRINVEEEEKKPRSQTVVTTTEVSIGKHSGFEDSIGVQNFLDFTRNSGRMPRSDSMKSGTFRDDLLSERSLLLNVSMAEGEEYRDRTAYGSTFK